MSVTPGLGAFNKDKVANKFGIQLKNKNTNSQTQQSSISPTTEKKISSVTKNNSICDFRSQDQSNGDLSKSPQIIRKMFEHSSEIKSHNDHLSISTNDQRRTSLHSNINHSTDSNLLTIKTPKSNSHHLLLQSTEQTESLSLTSTDQNKSPSISPSTSRRTSLTKTPERSLSPNPMSNQSKTPERPLSPVPTSQRPSIPTTTITKTEEEIEHQKDQPLYKRQLSKTLDNNTSTANKTKFPYELTNSR